jgi:hypothetical protein
MAQATWTVAFAQGRIGLGCAVEAVETYGTKRQITEVAFDRFASGRRVYLRGYEQTGSRFYHEIAKQVVLDSPAVADNPGAWVRFGGMAVRIGDIVPA